MASKLAVYVTGYEDERFQQIVSQTLHCIICTNVIKDPVMCRHNEHIFCRSCITKHLMNSQTCPTCMEPLTIDTLNQAPRGIRNLLAELKIRCEFFDRGCGKFIELGDLERHVRECGFAPAVCSNEGCRLEVNKHDLLHHETSVCELRRVKCHSCNDIRQEVDTVKVTLAGINEKLERNEKKISERFERIEKKLEQIKTSGRTVQELLKKQQESNRRLEVDNVDMKKRLNEIAKQLERITQQTSREVQGEQEQMKKGIAEAEGLDREPKVVVAGGGGSNKKTVNSVEMFSLSNGTWTSLQPLRENRSRASSFVHNNQIFVIGGWCDEYGEKLSMNAVQADQSITWENFSTDIVRLTGLNCVVYNGRLIVIGGFDNNECDCISCIIEIFLVPPYKGKVLCSMPLTRCDHGVALFGDKILVVGGRKNFTLVSAFRNVLMYDITKNECKKLASLPYSVKEMATVKWDDENVIILGGADGNNKQLNNVLMYNVKTEKSHALPNMKYKRRGCVAAVVRDTVIVMGGEDERGNVLRWLPTVAPEIKVETRKHDAYDCGSGNTRDAREIFVTPKKSREK